MKAYFQGHEVEISGSSVKINGNSKSIRTNAPQYIHKEQEEKYVFWTRVNYEWEIFK